MFVAGATHRVIAPDLPGIGDSAIPKDGLDMKTAAMCIHSLIRSIDVEKARVVGHDIGLMVAYAYAAQFPEATEKLVLMERAVPDSEALLDQAFAHGESAGSQTAQLLKLLDQYGAAALRRAVREALERNTPRASSVAFLLRKHQRSAKSTAPPANHGRDSLASAGRRAMRAPTPVGNPNIL